MGALSPVFFICIPLEGHVSVGDRDHDDFQLLRGGTQCQEHGQGIVNPYIEMSV